ncbi:MAG: hypothetical protein PHQ74_13355 [Crocinitomicaceae bacterium]|nr:hypothetical protein [Crocinitomicaceae bacterium]
MNEEITKLLKKLNSGPERAEIKLVDLFVNDKPYQFYNIENVTLFDLKGYSGIFFYCPVINGHIDVHSILYMGESEELSSVVPPLGLWGKLREPTDMKLYIALQEPEKIESVRKALFEKLIKEYSPLHIAQ